MKKHNRKESKLKDKRWITKLLFSIIFLLTSLIYIQTSGENKQKYENNILNDNIKFNTIGNMYDKYINSHFKKKDNQEKEMYASSENISYITKEKYNNSTKLTVNKEYAVQTLKPGIIVYIGEKDELGNTIIVQGNDGIDVWYSNITNTNYTLYDYVSKGDILGTTIDEYLYLTFDKDGTFLTYEEYIK